jgi:hypothetical protein
MLLLWCFPSLLLVVHIQHLRPRRWQRPKTSFKRGLTGRSVDCLIIKVLNVDQVFISSPWMLLIITLQKMNQFSVHYFFLLIYVCMECCRSIQLRVHLLPKCSPKVLRNMVSLFEMILLGILKGTQIVSKNIFVASCSLNLSTTTNR